MNEISTIIEGYSEQNVQVSAWIMRVVSYQLGDKFVCIVSNLDPGATLCRVTAQSRQEAHRTALLEVNAKLSRTVVDENPPPPPQLKLAKIVNHGELPPMAYSIDEFLGIPISDRMQFILGGSLKFLSENDVLISSGEAMRMLQEASR